MLCKEAEGSSRLATVSAATTRPHEKIRVSPIVSKNIPETDFKLFFKTKISNENFEKFREH